MTSHIINHLKYNLKITLSVYQNNHRLVQINYILNPASVDFAKNADVLQDFKPLPTPQIVLAPLGPPTLRAGPRFR